MKKILPFLVMGGIGLFFFVIPDFGSLINSIEQRNWIETTAQVTDVSVIRTAYTTSKTTVIIRIIYQYIVNGTSYTDRDIQKSSYVVPSERTEEDIRNNTFTQFPKGKTLTILVHPTAPQDSSVPEFHIMEIYSVILGCTMLLSSVVIIIVKLPRKTT